MDAQLTIRNLKESDYTDTLLDWWKWHRFPAPPRFILPDNISDGLMVEYNGKPLCAGFLYSTSSKYLFHVEWVVSTYKIKDKDIRKKGIHLLINGLSYVAREQGARAIYTSLVRKNLIDRYKECGWVEGSRNATEMIKAFQPSHKS